MKRAVHTARRDIRRVFVANRGEIAVRIIRACQSLGMETVAGVSEADMESMAGRMADDLVVIGAPSAQESYLRADHLVKKALETHCDAVHPGYGFLAEQSSFAQACRNAGLAFIGPDPDAIDSMGDKITANVLAARAGISCVPGSGALSDGAEAGRFASEIGYPVLVKATAGGGGRGMRIVSSADEMDAAFGSASKEAETAFANSTLFVEKFIQRARHIEIQVICDEHGNVVHLGERDCSTQRRHQKLIEEAPSPVATESMRTAMGEAARRLAEAVDYVGAGTVEFVVDDDSGEFYFLEMNTRIQVEHPVTEMISGYDLVAEQIRIACGLPLSFSQEDVVFQGHAIECRINAENPDKGFMPGPGLITSWKEPVGEGIRVDTHCYDGYTVPPWYDSLLGKLIVHAPDRQQAIRRMTKALAGFRVSGIETTIPFHREVIASDDFARGRVTTRWVEEVYLPERKARLRKEKRNGGPSSVAKGSGHG